MKRQATDRRPIFANHVSYKGFICKINKEFSKFNNDKTNDSILKKGWRQKIRAATSPKSYRWMEKKVHEKMLNIIFIRKSQIKI